MQSRPFPVIDLAATGENIARLRRARGLTVRELQAYFGFEEPQAIYKWQRGKSLPSVDNLYALSALLGIPMNEILVSQQNIAAFEQQAEPCCSDHLQARRNGSRLPPMPRLPAWAHCTSQIGRCHSTRGSMRRALPALRRRKAVHAAG